MFRYCEIGGTDLVVGNLIQAPAEIANHQAMTPSAAAIDATSIDVTPGATAGAADLYAGGIAVISTTPGLGYSYPVKGHLAISASTLFTIRLVEGWEVAVALTASSRVGLHSNPYRNVIQSPTTATNVPVGVAVYIITANQFGWLCTQGPCGVLIEGTPAVGLAVVKSTSVAGAVAIHTATGDSRAEVGRMMETGVDTEVNAVKLSID